MFRATLLTVVVLGSSGFARLLDVPGHFATISVALDSSQTSDTILVQRGEYNDRIIFPDRDVVLMSMYFTTGDTSAISGTVINATAFATAEFASTLNFLSGNSRAAFVGGFTLTGGHGRRSTSGDTTDHRRYGGGIFTTNSSPTIHSCRITADTASNECAIYAEYGAPLISHCELFANCGETVLVGIFGNQLGDPVVFEWNDIHGNFGCGELGRYLYANSVDLTQGNAVIRFNHFHDSEGWGALGVDAWRSYAEVSGNVFERLTAQYDACVVRSNDWGNTYRDNVFRDCQLGQMPCLNVDIMGPQTPYFQSLIERNWFENIAAPTGGPSALWMGDPDAEIRDNVFLNCSGIVGAVQFWQNPPHGCVATLEGNHFFFNTATGASYTGSAFTAAGSGPGCTFHNNWFEGNEGPAVAGDGQSHLITLDLSGNYWGDPSGPYDPVQNPQGRGDTLGVDVVVHDWLTEPPGTDNRIAERFHLKAEDWGVSTPFPNPFNAVTVIRLQSSKPQPFEVTVYNLLGRKVARVWLGVAPKDSQLDVRWDGKDERGANVASGVYYVVAKPVGSKTAIPKTVKAVLLR